MKRVPDGIAGRLTSNLTADTDTKSNADVTKVAETLSKAGILGDAAETRSFMEGKSLGEILDVAKLSDLAGRLLSSHSANFLKGISRRQLVGTLSSVKAGALASLLSGGVGTVHAEGMKQIPMTMEAWLPLLIFVGVSVGTIGWFAHRSISAHFAHKRDNQRYRTP